MAVAFAYMAWQIAAAPKWTVDDAFITFRYARNLVLHGELNWNVGEDPVEGYTGILWPLLLASGMAMGAAPVALSQVLGVSCWAAALIVAERLLRELGAARCIRGAVVLLLSASPIMVMHALAGLETTAFLAAVLACQWLLARAVRDPASSAGSLGLPFLSLTAGLLRPEGALVGLVACALVLLMSSSDGSRWRLRYLLKFAAVYLPPALAYFFWRWSYYGRLLPNSFFAKELDSWDSLGQLRSFTRFLEYYLMWPAAAAAALLVLFPARRGAREPAAVCDRIVRARWASVLFAMVLSATWCGQYLRTDPVMNYGHRYYAPVLALGLTTLGALISTRSLEFRSPVRGGALAGWRRPVHVLTVLLAVGVTLCRHVEKLKQDTWWQIRDMTLYQCLLNSEHEPAAAFLRRLLPPGERLAIHVDAGVLGFATESPALDLGRLNDEFLATEGRTAEEGRDYFFAHRPGALVMTSWHRGELHPRAPIGQAIVADARFAEYRLSAEFTSATNADYRQLVYFRDDLYGATVEGLEPRRRRALERTEMRLASPEQELVDLKRRGGE